ncbi:hypothetical protein K7432_001149 [Basidiobolus ranarum]|uniref:Uncharacterized protein n=1 Tax=Basidiobolus ranarum TaxID=34480 RepID=A0ABR2X3V3_9FUNG
MEQALLEDTITAVIIGLSLPLALDSAYQATRMVFKEPALIYKLNFIQAWVRCICSLLEVGLELQTNKDCYTITIQYHVAAFISLSCIHTILYLKAYYTSLSTKLVAVICVSLQGLGVFCLIQMFANYEHTKTMLGGCIINFSTWYTLALLSCTTTIMILLSSIFVYNIIRLSRFNNRGFYRILARDGAIFGIVIVFCDIILAVTTVLNFTNSWYLLYVGWTIKSRLMSEMMLATHNRRKGGWSSEDSPESNATYFAGTLMNEQPESNNTRNIELLDLSKDEPDN